MKTFWKFSIAVVAVFGLLQLVRPGIPAKPPAAEIKVPAHIHQILEKDCYSCHSDERRLAWFDEIQPGYWLVRKDILTAREHLNFSTLGGKPAAAQTASLYEAVNMIQLGAMPLPRFVALHPDARVSPEELAELKAYLAPWAHIPTAPPADNGAHDAQHADTPMFSLAAVKAGWNGVAFDPSFETWKPLSYTDRGDNNTFRFILGNDVAVKAAESGNISPWPDGTRFAKIAWQQEMGNDGIVRPGKFVQVELMIKNSKKYASTDGWGWGRWRGTDLIPYGKDAHFVTECTSCHQPVKGNDYVYTLPITDTHATAMEAVNNRAAALPSSLPYQPLRWTPITMFVDPKAHTMSTLLGNNVAIQSIHQRGSAVSLSPHYAPGAILSLVTWEQREDPHWFGGRIPDRPISVEYVELDSQARTNYRIFSGAELSEQRLPQADTTQRISNMLGLKAVVLP